MTTPGYPDYQSYPQWRGIGLWNGSFNIAVGTNFFVQETVTNWASLAMFLKLQSGTGVTVFVSFFNDAAATQFVGNYVWTVSVANTILDVVVPCLGNYCQIFVNTGQAGNQNILIGFTTTNTPATRGQYQLTNNVVAGLTITVNAGTTFSTVLPQVVDGDGEFYFNAITGGANSIGQIYELDEGTNLFAQVVKILNPAAPTVALFKGGVRPLNLQIKNTDVANHTYDYRCTVVSR